MTTLKLNWEEHGIRRQVTLLDYALDAGPQYKKPTYSWYIYDSNERYYLRAEGVANSLEEAQLAAEQALREIVAVYKVLDL